MVQKRPAGCPACHRPAVGPVRAHERPGGAVEQRRKRSPREGAVQPLRAPGDHDHRPTLREGGPCQSPGADLVDERSAGIDGVRPHENEVDLADDLLERQVRHRARRDALAPELEGGTPTLAPRVAHEGEHRHRLLPPWEGHERPQDALAPAEHQDASPGREPPTDLEGETPWFRVEGGPGGPEPRAHPPKSLLWSGVPRELPPFSRPLPEWAHRRLNGGQAGGDRANGGAEPAGGQPPPRPLGPFEGPHGANGEGVRPPLPVRRYAVEGGPKLRVDAGSHRGPPHAER